MTGVYVGDLLHQTHELGINPDHVICIGVQHLGSPDGRLVEKWWRVHLKLTNGLSFVTPSRATHEEATKDFGLLTQRVWGDS